MNIAQAFTKAWQDLKAGATKVESFLAKNQSSIQAAVADGSAVAVAAGAPPVVVTSLDTLEEVIMGKIAAAAQDVTKANSLTDVIGDALPTIQALLGTLKSHPTVASVTTALGGGTAATPAAK